MTSLCRHCESTPGPSFLVSGDSGFSFGASYFALSAAACSSKHARHGPCAVPGQPDGVSSLLASITRIDIKERTALDMMKLAGHVEKISAPTDSGAEIPTRRELEEIKNPDKKAERESYGTSVSAGGIRPSSRSTLTTSSK